MAVLHCPRPSSGPLRACDRHETGRQSYPRENPVLRTALRMRVTENRVPRRSLRTFLLAATPRFLFRNALRFPLNSNISSIERYLGERPLGGDEMTWDLAVHLSVASGLASQAPWIKFASKDFYSERRSCSRVLFGLEAITKAGKWTFNKSGSQLRPRSACSTHCRAVRPSGGRQWQITHGEESLDLTSLL